MADTHHHARPDGTADPTDHCDLLVRDARLLVIDGDTEVPGGWIASGTAGSRRTGPPAPSRRAPPAACPPPVAWSPPG
ncbi:hypothetical protein O1L55_14885 [Streptomyces albulus]|nr:hypothetical protein [Streptomyces noursei]